MSPPLEGTLNLFFIELGLGPFPTSGANFAFGVIFEVKKTSKKLKVKLN